jgi:hypothetical protein
MVRNALIHALPPAQVGLLAAEARVGTRAARILRRLCRENDRAVTSGHHIEVIPRRGSTIIAGHRRAKTAPPGRSPLVKSAISARLRAPYPTCAEVENAPPLHISYGI